MMMDDIARRLVEQKVGSFTTEDDMDKRFEELEHLLETDDG